MSQEEKDIGKITFEEAVERTKTWKPESDFKFYQAQLRQYEKGFYDIQKSRIAIGQRLTSNFFTRAGIKPGKKKDSVRDKWAQKVLEMYESDFLRLADFVSLNSRQLNKVLSDSDAIIHFDVELIMTQVYLQYVEYEKVLKTRIKNFLDEHFDIWNLYLKNILGVGPLMAAVTIGELDIYRAEYVSSLWAAAGMDVVTIFDDDGNVIRTEGRGRKKEHLIEVTYIDKNGKEQTKLGLSYNPFLKQKLMGGLAPSFLRAYALHAGKPGQYGEIYYNYRNRQVNARELKILDRVRNGAGREQAEKEAKKELSDGHIRMRSLRYMIKMYLQDLYPVWRAMENLPVNPPYAEAKLGKSPHNKEKA